MARPKKTETKQETRQETSRPSSRSYRRGGNSDREYTQVTKLFESAKRPGSFSGKAQGEKLEALVDRLGAILDAGKAAQFFANLDGKFGPFLSVTESDKYESKDRGRGGYSQSRGNDRGWSNEGQERRW